MKAIETEYRGYRFRSRLEARWAVFLDSIDAAWEYEVEGFELPSGRYLPDFFIRSPDVGSKLRWQGAWLEVKPTPPTETERRLLSELAFATDCIAILAVGLPGSNYLFEASPEKNCYQHEYLVPVADSINIQFLLQHTIGRFLDWRDRFRIDIDRHIRAAKQARFEHGQLGRPSDWT
jgi:hypothetical protein